MREESLLILLESNVMSIITSRALAMKKANGIAKISKRGIRNHAPPNEMQKPKMLTTTGIAVFFVA